MRLSRLLLAWLVASAPAVAKPWNGITPGQSSSLDVVARFGEPTRTVSANGKDTLVYSGRQAIKGAAQAQFKLGADRTTVERIDVYPAVVLDAGAIERGYGPACDAKEATEPCFVKKETPQHHAYYVYPKLGLAVFFQADGSTVQSLAFLPEP